MKETMTVKELKNALEEVPDDYYIRTRSENAHLDNDEVAWQLGFSGVVKKGSNSWV